MGDGDGFDSGGAAEPPEAFEPVYRRIDPTVDADWFGRRASARRRLRLSTVALTLAFATVLALYLLWRPGG